jgi:hypothetical protein
MTTRIKVVPNETPNADGEWLDIDLDLPERMRWRDYGAKVAAFVPAGHQVVAVERGVKVSADHKVVSLKP